MAKKRKPIHTTKKEIINYWIHYKPDDQPNFDWSEANEICWRCGYKRRLQRCHIIPDSLGGKDEPSNFVLLCSECHQEAPNVESKTFMWDWINSYYSPFYNTFWTKRGMEEYERIYHKSFYDELKERNIITDHAISKFWSLKTGRTSFHFGHPYGNVSTIAGNYRMHLEAFDKKYPNGKYLEDNKIKEEKNFEILTHRICYLAEKYSFSVWEGGTKNPNSLCISSFYPQIGKILGICIKMYPNEKYKMFIGNEYNPNHLLVKDYTIDFEGDFNIVLDKIEKEILNLNASFGTPENKNPHFLVSDLYWSRKHDDNY